MFAHLNQCSIYLILKSHTGYTVGELDMIVLDEGDSFFLKSPDIYQRVLAKNGRCISASGTATTTNSDDTDKRCLKFLDIKQLNFSA